MSFHNNAPQLSEDAHAARADAFWRGDIPSVERIDASEAAGVREYEVGGLTAQLKDTEREIALITGFLPVENATEYAIGSVDERLKIYHAARLTELQAEHEATLNQLLRSNGSTSVPERVDPAWYAHDAQLR